MENKNLGEKFPQQLHKILAPAASWEALLNNWQEELILRRRLRTLPASACQLTVKDPEEFLFYRRAFYDVGEKKPFFAILMNQLASPVLPELLPQQPPELIRDFFVAFQQHIASHLPGSDELRACIVLFKPEYSGYYPNLLSAFTERDLKLLLDKTASFALRSLITEALEKIQKEHSLETELATTSKEQRLRLATESVRELKIRLKRLPEGEVLEPEHIKPLFTAGKIEVIMEILQRVKRLPQEEAALAPLRDFLHMLIPLYALLQHPENAYRLAQQLYLYFFPEEKSLPVSFHYLHLYQLAARHLTFEDMPFKREFAVRTRQLLKERPDDAAALLWQHPDFPEQLEEETAQRICREARTRLENAPHETWALLMILYCTLASDMNRYSAPLLVEMFFCIQMLYDWLGAPALLPPEKIAAAFYGSGNQILQEAWEKIRKGRWEYDK